MQTHDPFDVDDEAWKPTYSTFDVVCIEAGTDVDPEWMVYHADIDERADEWILTSTLVDTEKVR